MSKPRIVILVPWRPGDEQRQRLWSFARARWASDFPQWPIFEGNHIDGPFNRSAALNAAAAEAGAWDVAVVIDADVIANPDAVRNAAEIAATSGRVVVSHHDRVMLNRAGTAKVLAGYQGPWRVRPMVDMVYTDSVSCSIAVPRKVWDLVGGFDERFSGWGYEDSAFDIAVATLTGKPFVRLASELFHLWHPVSPEAASKAPTRSRNADRLDRYRSAAGDPAAVRALITEASDLDLGPSRIPRILHRTVPATTSAEVETWWEQFRQLHPGWELRTHRDPLDPGEWPETGDLWARCTSGAQKAGLIRLEALWRWGGIYVDSDVEPYRSLEPLLHVPAFAAWEDAKVVPDAVLGAEPAHPAFRIMLDRARAAIEAGAKAWESGPGVTTSALPGRPDVLLLPPGSFFPYHYSEKTRRREDHRTAQPWCFGAHHWHHSWKGK